MTMAAGFYDISNETLGKGHYAVVKKGKHCLTGESVALKIIDKTRLNRENLQQLGIEIRLLQILSEHEHQNIMKLYQVIDTKTKLYLVTEFCGEKDKVRDLYDYLHRASTSGLPEPEARHIFRQICDAISYCHSLRIVHRDLKPENILIVDPPDGYDPTLVAPKTTLIYPLVKLIDFGFSNQWDEGQKLRTSCGSLAYSAPEILVGDHYDGAKVDIWGLGCILYILLYGSNPFMQVNDSETICRILDCTFSMPPRSSVSQEAVQLIKSLLKRDPGSRLAVKEILTHPWVQRDRHLPGGGSSTTGSTSVSSSSLFNSSVDSDTDSLGGGAPASVICSGSERATPCSTPPPPTSFPSPIHNATSTNGSEHPPRPKIAKLGRQSTRERLHESVVDLMLQQGMCTSRGDIEKVLENTKTPSPESAPPTGLPGRPGTKSNTLVASNVRPSPGSTQMDGVANKTTTGTLQSSSPAPAIKNEMYIRATYHLLKDKIIREQAAAKIEKANRENMPARRSAFPSRGPRRILQPQQRPRFTPPLPEEQEASATTSAGLPVSRGGGRVSQMPISGPDPTLEEDEEEEVPLPLQRKCSIVSEEASCHGCDTGSESGSVFGDSYAEGGRNLSRGSSRNFDADGCLPTIGKQIMQMPIVEIIITDCSDGERGNSSDEDEDDLKKKSDQNDISQKSDESTLKEDNPSSGELTEKATPTTDDSSGQKAVFDLNQEQGDIISDGEEDDDNSVDESIPIQIADDFMNQVSEPCGQLHMVSSSPELHQQLDDYYESANQNQNHRPSIQADFIQVLEKQATESIHHAHPSHVHGHYVPARRRSSGGPVQPLANTIHHAHFHHHAKPISAPGVRSARISSLTGTDRASSAITRMAHHRIYQSSVLKTNFNKIVPEMQISGPSDPVSWSHRADESAGSNAPSAMPNGTAGVPSHRDRLSSNSSRGQHTLEDSLNAQIRIITTSKSCNNILYDEAPNNGNNNTDDVDGTNGKRRSSKKKSSSSRKNSGNGTTGNGSTSRGGSIKSISERLTSTYPDLCYMGKNNNNNCAVQTEGGDEEDGETEGVAGKLKPHFRRQECCIIS